MDRNEINSIQKLYEYYKEQLPGNLVKSSDNSLIWKIDKSTSLFIILNEYKINLVTNKKTLVELSKNDDEYYSKDNKLFFKDCISTINKLKKGEEKEQSYSKNYCLSLNKKRNKRYIIVSTIVTIIILWICYSILFK